MAKIRLTKNELKQQKDALKRFQRYLPTLQLKKQQLQMVIRQVEHKIREKKGQKNKVYSDIKKWVVVFGEDKELSQYIEIKAIETEEGNIAGIDIPVFKGIEFGKKEYDLFIEPLWIDRGIKALQQLITFDAEIEILTKQIERLAEELRITTQRVNLFEKVMIPETQENIRKIRIYLGDQQTAAVVRGKIAKNNLVKG